MSREDKRELSYTLKSMIFLFIMLGISLLFIPDEIGYYGIVWAIVGFIVCIINILLLFARGKEKP